ncbi:NEL-type E3 ubiquitin ligase domain-containing protein [Bradyrhizobium sp. CCBAU 11430]|uniref:NEL-type E3 ubiquitin ligase domain-containing protein n=1 Tax=Bradyrhizobium sp. CCBAU 11430 TaxID=1630881 RepID=UPI0023054B6B|nr:NEL-type E3 ubiquitin ligase domain-containing protein [Bradyrhizobium sp. CCBAU 11430]
MNTNRTQLDSDGFFSVSGSEASQSEASEPGTPVAAHWDEALTDARPSAPTAAGPQGQVVDARAADEGQDEDENRQTAITQTRALPENGSAALNLSSLSLTALPAALPPELQVFNARDNQLASLPALPEGLRVLNAARNLLTSLPADLPSRLRSLIIGENSLTSLPALPATLRELSAYSNHLTSLPALPAGLRSLVVDNNQLTSLPALPTTLEELYAASNHLTSLPDLPAGLRSLVVDNNQLTILPALPATVEELHAAGNQLTSLPDLPAGLQNLDAGDNQLANLPALPSTLRDLVAPSNQLTSLPDLPASIESLVLDSNQLTELPEPLPSAIELLTASDNQLVRLPELPASLEVLDVSNNGLTDVPASLLQLASDAALDLTDNPLREGVQSNLLRARSAADYAGPRILFSLSEDAMEPTPRPLHEVVANWFGHDLAMIATWQSFADEPGVRDYARFLDRLAGTVNYGNSEFRQAVVEDLRQAAARPRLRELFFQLASDACASCQDRITLAWNGMQTARLNADIEDGLYDDRLAELLQHARVMFRLEALDGIARQEVNVLRHSRPVDETEVYLAYQTQLRDPLELRHVAPDMRFFSVSGVTRADVERALATVRQQETIGFADYLATRWQPWETVLRRIAPEEHAAMDDRLIDAMGEEFQIRLNQRLAEVSLAGDADAERIIGPQIVNEIAREIKIEVMHRVLRAHGIEL